MLELWFSGREEADKAEDELSKFGDVVRSRRVESDTDEHSVLSKPCEEAIEYLDEEIGEEEDEKSAPAMYKQALETIKDLLESGDYEEILAAEDNEEAEERLYDAVEDLEHVRELKERVSREYEESSEGDEEEDTEEGEDDEEEEEGQEVTREEMQELFSMRNYLVSPILDVLRDLEDEEDPLETFLDDVDLEVSSAGGQFEDLDSEVRVQSSVGYGLRLGIDHVMHANDVLGKIQQFRVTNQPKNVIYGLINLHVIAEEIISKVRGKKKVMYNEFVAEVQDEINDVTQELEGGKLRPVTDEDTIDYVVRKLKRAGYVRKKGNKISDARA